MTGEPKKRSEHDREPDEYEPVNASTERALSNELISLVRTRIATRSTEGAAHVTAADRVDASLAAKLEPDAFGSDLRHGVSVERRGGIARAGR